MRRHILASSGIHLLILILGLGGIYFYKYKADFYYSSLHEKNAQLEQTNANKYKLFSIIAHDLRNPFHTILGYIEMLKLGYSSLSDDDRSEIITELDKSSNRAFELLENLLLWARVQRDKIEINAENLNLKTLIEETVDTYLSGAWKKIFPSSLTYLKISVFPQIVIPQKIFCRICSQMRSNLHQSTGISASVRNG